MANYCYHFIFLCTYTHVHTHEHTQTHMQTYVHTQNIFSPFFYKNKFISFTVFHILFFSSSITFLLELPIYECLCYEMHIYMMVGKAWSLPSCNTQPKGIKVYMTSLTFDYCSSTQCGEIPGSIKRRVHGSKTFVVHVYLS